MLPHGSRVFPRPVASGERAAPISTPPEGPGALGQEELKGSMDTRAPERGGIVVPEENGKFLKLNRRLPTQRGVWNAENNEKQEDKNDQKIIRYGGGGCTAVEQKD